MLHALWPSLLNIDGFLQEFVTPIIKVSSLKAAHSSARHTSDSAGQVFFTLPEYDAWRRARHGDGEVSSPSAGAWRVKYYKGLGTSTAAEAKEYFRDIEAHRLRFAPMRTRKAVANAKPAVVAKGNRKLDDSSLIRMAFAKGAAAAAWRRGWIDAYVPGTHIDHAAASRSLTYSDFINKELVLHSRAACFFSQLPPRHHAKSITTVTGLPNQLSGSH